MEGTFVSTTRRISQTLLGVTLAVLGAAGLAATWVPEPAQAQSGESDAHDTMHEMMEAMHGEEAVERMHEAEGADEMMDQCAGMMAAMGGMSDMMDGQGSSDMMRGRMGR